MTTSSKVRLPSKERMMKVREILTKYTDEENWLSIAEIIDIIQRHYGDNLEINRKAVKNDIDKLMDSGFPITINVGPRGKKLYSYQERLFELYDLRVLIDAVSSARFITKQETDCLIKKIKKLCSDNVARRLHNHIFIDDHIKTKNHKVKYYIDAIHTGIDQQKKLTFQYRKYNVEKEFILHNNGKIYKVDPYGLVWNSDFYYLIAKEEGDTEFKHFRVDRLDNVQLTDQHFKRDHFDIAEYVSKTFNMYAGIVQPIEIQFQNHLINVVIDRFGTNVKLEKVDEHTFKIRIHAAMSKGLVRWILTWGSDAKVLSPQNLVDELKQESEKMARMYM